MSDVQPLAQRLDVVVRLPKGPPSMNLPQWHQAITRAFLSHFNSKLPAARRRNHSNNLHEIGLSQAAEVLEERLMLSATVGEFDGLSYEEWQGKTFSLETPTLVESISAAQADLEVGIKQRIENPTITAPYKPKL